MRREREAVVAPGQDADAALAHATEDVDAHLELALEVRRALGGDAPLARRLAQVVGDAEGGADEDPVARRLEGVEGALVGPVRVIDDLDAVAQRDHHRFRAAAVGGHAQPRGTRDLHGGRHLGVGHRRLVGRVA